MYSIQNILQNLNLILFFFSVNAYHGKQYKNKGYIEFVWCMYNICSIWIRNELQEYSECVDEHFYRNIYS